jgi:multidrug transporter EmrE-like cation transporter
MRFLYLGLAVAFNVAAYVVFKAISPRPRDVLWTSLFGVGLALGGVNTFFFNGALRELRLAVAYPAFAGTSIALVVVVSAAFFKEPIAVSDVLGAAAIVLGIFLLTR